MEASSVSGTSVSSQGAPPPVYIHGQQNYGGAYSSYHRTASGNRPTTLQTMDQQTRMVVAGTHPGGLMGGLSTMFNEVKRDLNDEMVRIRERENNPPAPNYDPRYGNPAMQPPGGYAAMPGNVPPPSYSQATNGNYAVGSQPPGVHSQASSHPPSYNPPM